MVRIKQIPHIRVGKRILFQKDSIYRWIMEKEIFQ
nr:hypothetical protein [Bacillus sp. Marseille-P3661]